MSESHTIPAPPVLHLSEEEQSVLEWRYSQARLLGFDRDRARDLAASRAELALLRRLVADGCPLELAFAIAR
jgi:hypothetical protein